MKHDYVCAECGTTEATTYVVTITGPLPEGRTEVCRACDDALRTPVLAEVREIAERALKHRGRDSALADRRGTALNDIRVKIWEASK